MVVTVITSIIVLCRRNSRTATFPGVETNNTKVDTFQSSVSASFEMLADLPAELLNQIISHSSATSIGHLSQTSRPLHEFVEREGWRSYVQTTFPSLRCPPCWRDAAHSLTTLTRNWQRRAFIAQYLEPAGDIANASTNQPLKKWRRPGGQTMGFQPSVDSYETFPTNRWTDRREVVAWSAGAELVVRVRVRNSETEQAYRIASPQERRDRYGTNGMRTKWWSYRPLSAAEGRDDITSIKIIKPNHTQGHNDVDAHKILVGTANGDLHLVQVPAEDMGPIKTHFVTNGVPVRSIALSPSSTFMVANLSDTKLSLFNIDPSKLKVAPSSEVNAMPDGKKGCRIWSTRFLDAKRLAIGLGPSVQPINIFEVRPDGITAQPIRKIGLGGDADALMPGQASSIYPIEALLDVNGGTGEGNLFMSGGYDGIIRLHDLRSPSSYETMYQDPTDDAAIYSLLSRGRDRVVAGTSRHCLVKVFDLRVSGASQYDYAGFAGEGEEGPSKDDWNIFINPRHRYANTPWRGPNSWMRRSAEGSVYSLSSPSPTSPLIYAGVENAVVEFNFSSVLDPHPDPLFTLSNDDGSKPAYFKSKQDVLNLAMYAQGTDGSKEAMKLRGQRSIDETIDQQRTATGLDERWKESQ